VGRTTSPDGRTTPSESARALVRGGYDLHVHVAPDLIPRRIDDVALAERCREVGLAGFVLKSHYQVTAERAAVVAGVVPGVDVLGAITLNSPVGGLSALAVEIAARSGARFVWMPTFDAANETAGRGEPEPGATLPVWAELQVALRGDGVESPPITVLDEQGGLRPEAREVIATAARHQLVLGTGHLARDEIFAVVRTARELGVERIVVTHPDFPSQNLAAEDQRALADLGALLERCFAPSHTGRVPWERVLARIREAGPERSFISSDLGQVNNPAVEDGLALFADRLLEAGFSAEAIHTMAVVNTRRLAVDAAAP
jgi:Family of unknown function (DUF6282)